MGKTPDNDPSQPLISYERLRFSACALPKGYTKSAWKSIGDSGKTANTPRRRGRHTLPKGAPRMAGGYRISSPMTYNAFTAFFRLKQSPQWRVRRASRRNRAKTEIDPVRLYPCARIWVNQKYWIFARLCVNMCAVEGVCRRVWQGALRDEERGRLACLFRPWWVAVGGAVP